MHKRRPDFDPLRFTPTRIANKIDIPTAELAEYFQTHSLKDCATKYNCSAATIKRKLKNAGYDTSIHNHSNLAKERYAETVKNKPDDDTVRELYIEDNLDTKTIAEIYGLHFNTIRNIIRRLGLRKTREQINSSMVQRHLLKHGVKYPAQRPDVIKRTSASLNKARYKDNCFKSITELGFALYLDKNRIEWYYEEMRIPYVDMLEGKQRIYVIDFTLIDGDDVSWVEVKPDNKMIPDDKRIYASRRAEEADITYRGLTDTEREGLWNCIYEGYGFDQVEFLHRTPRSVSTKITHYFKSENEALNFQLDGWRQFCRPTNRGALWKKVLVRK